jgi:outer membrane cobalamin receptor
MPTVIAQEQAVEEVIVTGSRIRRPGLESGSPIVSVGAEEFELQQEVELEQVLRTLPSTTIGDNENVNNGTGGYTTANLRGLGANRNLVLLNGKRMAPANYNGTVDLSTIPTALIERVDVITGGAFGGIWFRRHCRRNQCCDEEQLRRFRSSDQQHHEWRQRLVIETISL